MTLTLEELIDAGRKTTRVKFYGPIAAIEEVAR